MDEFTKEFYEDIQKGKYFYRDGIKIRGEEAKCLRSLFILAAENAGQETVRLHAENKSKYANVINTYKLRGVKIETNKLNMSEYEYIVTVNTKTLLGELSKFKASW